MAWNTAHSFSSLGRSRYRTLFIMAVLNAHKHSGSLVLWPGMICHSCVNSALERARYRERPGRRRALARTRGVMGPIFMRWP